MIKKVEDDFQIIKSAYQQKIASMQIKLSELQDKFKTCMSIKGEYEELITKLCEDMSMKTKIGSVMRELRRARSSLPQIKQNTKQIHKSCSKEHEKNNNATNANALSGVKTNKSDFINVV